MEKENQTPPAATRPVESNGSFLGSLKVQIRIISAVVKREFITRYGRFNIGFLWMFGEPMMFTIGVAFIWRYMDHRSAYIHGDISIVTFALTGYSQVMLWRNGVSRCMKAIEPNLGLLFHRNVQVFDVMMARLVLEIAGGTISFIVLMTFCVLTGIIAPPHDVLTMIYGWSLLAWYSVGMGLIAGAISEFSDTFVRLVEIFNYLYLVPSGLFYMVDWLPGWVQKYVMLIPTVDTNELIRSGYYGPLMHAHYDVPYLMEFNLVLVLIGLLLIKMAERRVEFE